MRAPANLQEVGPGRYEGAMNLSMRGAWPLTIEMEDPETGDEMRLRFDLATDRAGLELQCGATPVRSGDAAADGRGQSGGVPIRASAAADDGANVIRIDNRRRQMIGVETGDASYRQLVRPIRAVGEVAYDERLLSQITLKFDGYIGDLQADYVGAPVEEGQVLFTVGNGLGNGTARHPRARPTGAGHSRTRQVPSFETLDQGTQGNHVQLRRSKIMQNGVVTLCRRLKHCDDRRPQGNVPNTPDARAREPDPMRRHLSAALILVAATAPFTLPSRGRAAAPVIEVWTGPSCSCCHDWIAHLESSGFDVVAHDGGNSEARAELGMPVRYGSCHTAAVEGFAIEGHVPASEIRRLLAERPDAIGLSVPAMPRGAPGMDGPIYGGARDPYDVLLIARDGSAQIYRSYR